MPRSKSKRKRKKAIQNRYDGFEIILSSGRPDGFETDSYSERPLVKDANSLIEKFNSDIESGLDITSVREKHESEVIELISKIDNAKLQRNKLLSEFNEPEKYNNTTGNEKDFELLFAETADIADLEFEISVSSTLLIDFAPKFGNRVKGLNKFLRNEKAQSLKEFWMILLFIPIGWIAKQVFRFTK